MDYEAQAMILRATGCGVTLAIMLTTIAALVAAVLAGKKGHPTIGLWIATAGLGVIAFLSLAFTALDFSEPDPDTYRAVALGMQVVELGAIAVLVAGLALVRAKRADV